MQQTQANRPGVVRGHSTNDLQTWRDVFGLVCGPACLLVVIEMLLSFNMYSGRAHQHSQVA
jgi:hypothetical protein